MNEHYAGMTKKKLLEFEETKRENMIMHGFGPEIMKTQKVCKACGCTCCADEKHCTSCGTILPKETLFELYQSYHIRCPSCSTSVNPTYLFCPICGKQLKKQFNK